MKGLGVNMPYAAKAHRPGMVYIRSGAAVDVCAMNAEWAAKRPLARGASQARKGGNRGWEDDPVYRELLPPLGAAAPVLRAPQGPAWPPRTRWS